MDLMRQLSMPNRARPIPIRSPIRSKSSLYGGVPLVQQRVRPDANRGRIAPNIDI
jgi:hypothetical protein